MSLRDKLIGLEEQASRECTVTMRVCGGRERELFIENCRKIISCDNDFITLGIYGAEIRVSGTPLYLENFGVNGVKITGKICSVEFSESMVDEK